MERAKACLAETVSGHLTVSTSAAAFRQRLEDAGIEPYERGGRLAGVRYHGRKYRLGTLGLSEAELEHAERIWRTTPSRLRTLTDLLAEKTRGLVRGLGYAREMMAVLDRAPMPALSRALSERLSALERLEHDKRLRSRRRLERVR